MQALMQYIAVVTQFLKRHYEKIILCAVLLGLAAAAVWMGSIVNAVRDEVNQATVEAPVNPKPLVPLDLSNDFVALAQVTNPPAVVLSGEHNLFNPVTWRRKPNGELIKLLKTGPEALTISDIKPLFTQISFNHASGGDVYVLDIQQHSVKKAPEYSKVGEKKKLYTIRGIEGAADNPDALILEIPDMAEPVKISKEKPFKEVDGHIADMEYKPQSQTLTKVRVNDTITLDNEQYKVVEITNNVVRVQNINTTQVTPVNWSGTP